MKRLTFCIALLSVVSAVQAEIFTTVYMADGNTPLELVDPYVYRPIMAGTHLIIIVSSDTNDYWFGTLTIWDANQNNGQLYARDYNDETSDWKGSRFPAAGDGAAVWDYAGNAEEHNYIGFELVGGDPSLNAIPGNWFIIDYNAIASGNCTVKFYDGNLDVEYPLFFTQVITRDLNNDGVVDFEDFTVLGQNWQRTDCLSPGYCSGSDLDEDGDVDLTDLKLFADFWLERTR